VKSHGAAITVESQVGVGTIFRLYFPATETPVIESAAPAAADLHGHGEHVLYVDAEEAIVDVASRLLTDLGYRVTGTTSPGHALADVRSRPYEFAVLVTDLATPGLPGAELARRVREIRPGIPVVLTSGYLRPEDAEAVHRLGEVDVILKSTLVADLGPTLHRLLTGSRPAA
jgi:CheY-like chemotaxis protein